MLPVSHSFHLGAAGDKGKSAVDAMLQRPSHVAAAALRDSINGSAPFASELRAERRAARNLERRVTATMLSAKLRSISVSD